MSLQLEIVTPLGSVLTAAAEEVVLPGKIGEFAVLDGHIPLLSALKPGVVRYTEGGKEHTLAIGSGFAEVGANDRVLVLADAHAFADDVDLDKARAELREAEDALSGWEGEVEELDTDDNQWKEIPEHRALLERAAWAQAQIDVKG